MGFGLQAANVQGTPYLTNFTHSLVMSQAWLALKLAPTMPVPAESGSYWCKPFAYGRVDGDTSQDGMSEAPISAPPLQTGTYTTKPNSHGSFLSDRIRNNASMSPTGFKGIEELYASWPALVQAMHLEKALYTLLTTTGTYYNSSHYVDLSATPTLQFDAATTSDPLATLITYARVIQARSGLPRKALTVTMGRAVYDVLVRHTAIVNQIKYTRSSLIDDVNESDLAKFFGVKEVLVGDVLEVTSAPGATEVSAFTWGKDMFITYVDPAPNALTGTATSFFTASMTANGAGGSPWIARAIPKLDPLGTKYIVEGIFNVNAGKVTGEGVRTAAWIQNAVTA